ncbi:MAG: dihydropteroate synthase [Pyrinomonadaceae bacterium]|nr:dihydropteroate synthase [Pyrinomonadaceae bacterium]
MGILNVTPDSFSDGGKFNSIDAALEQAEKMIIEGADILDIGGESSRPKSARVSAEEETRRVVPVIEAIAKRFDIAISIDTTKAEVAQNAVNAGAEIINDISGLRFDEKIGEVAAKSNAGLILMHLRGTFETMHNQTPVNEILTETIKGLRESVEKAVSFGVNPQNIALDIGIGFSKTLHQNLELLAKLNQVCIEFADLPMLVGTSRKSFIAKILGDIPMNERLSGSLASVAIAVFNGANIVRVHDVRQSIEAVKIAEAIKNCQNPQI